MELLQVSGGTVLKGEYSPEGAKNAVLPIMAAAILVDGQVILNHVPDLTDVKAMCDILRRCGCQVQTAEDAVSIDTKALEKKEIPEELMKTMRASNLIWGPFLSRFGRADIPMPGGCPIGSRPMDIHIQGLRELGVEIDEHGGVFVSRTKGLKGSDIYLDFPSVGATENLIMAAVKAKGCTVLRNAAKEPEVVDLCRFLNKAGAKILGAGTDTIVIHGVSSLTSVEHTVVPDRIVAGTVLLAAVVTGGKIRLSHVDPGDMEPVLAKLHEAGVQIQRGESAIEVEHRGGIKPLQIKTLPYPGFPTDIQPQFLAALATAKGTSLIRESIFENRFQHCNELKKMGADIEVEGRLAVVKGVKHLEGAKVEAADLRGGAALLIAALAAKG
ncbi:MAG: UDP-N-acetylglucosamine 1-carboxyvinyltransferase, partial [Bacillota bacterium]|nr:UDP-N-acetylglucosamine 1-carboxyvinyltransferase [Bacillota bacterium]